MSIHDPRRTNERGRGAQSNRAGRFEPYAREAEDDGWGQYDDLTELPPLATEVRDEPTRRIITTNDSPDVPFDRSINPYKGCEHGCIYCFARPTHAYLGLSPGLDFETKLVAKPEAPLRLRQELSRPRYRCAPLALGANVDPYQPIERERRITRGVLEVLQAFHHPVGIVTKSNLVLRDLDILAPMASKSLASVMVSITTLEPALARVMEPRASTPARRLEAVRRLSEAGVPVGVLASPMIPGINDAELEAILEAAKQAGATAAGTILVRLPLEIKDLFSEWLEAHFPDRKEHVLNLIRDTRNGELYESTFGDRMRGSGPYASILAQRFRLATTRLGLHGRTMNLDVTQFQVPPKEPQGQLSLF